MSRIVLFLVTGLVFCGQASAERNWTSFRGPSGQGISHDAQVPTSWSETKNVAWKAAIPGRGWSSPVTWGDEIWLTTAIETPVAGGGDSEPKSSQSQVVGAISLRAVSIDRSNGRVLKNVELFSIKNPESIHTLNSFASPTPVVEEGRVYCHFGTFGTACVESSTGETLWTRQLPLEHAVGPGSSPLLWRNLLVLVCDGMDDQFVVALDKHTGDTVWRKDRPPMEGDDGDFHKAFSTPLAVQWNDQEQLIIPGAQWFVALEPQTGEMLWWIRHGRGFSNVAAPVFADGISYLITGFTKPELWAVPISQRGELTASNVLWEQKKLIPKKSSPLLVAEEVYLVSDNGVLSCVDINSGDILWSRRLGGNYSASPIGVDGKIFICSHEGKTTVFSPSRSGFQSIAVNQLDGQLMASPVPSENALYIRSDRHLYRIQEN